MPLLTLKSDPSPPIAATHKILALPDVRQDETYTQDPTAIGYTITKNPLGSGAETLGVSNRDSRPTVIAPRMRLRTSLGAYENLDPSFRVQKHDFFKVGKVFKVLWPELAGDINHSSTIATSAFLPETRVFWKIRWFMVVRTGNGCCTCL
jgi:hypothetical protein